MSAMRRIAASAAQWRDLAEMTDFAGCAEALANR
jgi:hypothetical protein